MTLDINPTKNDILKPQITVFGVGGAGGNATSNMIRKKLEGANFVVANTDAQALEHAATSNRIQLGRDTTRGLGAGAAPEVGKAAAEEALDEIKEHLDGCNMAFITAGMGGGTGTGAAAVIAKTAKEAGILTVGVVTKPFHFEGPRRMALAEEGLQELQQVVDTLIVIPNQNLFRVANEKTTFADAFAMADDVLYSGVRSVTDLMIMPGLINLDFADVKAVMTQMGKAMMGTGEAEGEGRARQAAEAAIANPLLDHDSMKGARGVLINITGGSDMTLFEVDEAANRIREEVDPNANIIFGSTFSEELQGKLRVAVVATGIDAANFKAGIAASQASKKAHQVAQPSPEQSSHFIDEDQPEDVASALRFGEASTEAKRKEAALLASLSADESVDDHEQYETRNNDLRAEENSEAATSHAAHAVSENTLFDDNDTLSEDYEPGLFHPHENDFTRSGQEAYHSASLAPKSRVDAQRHFATPAPAEPASYDDLSDDEGTPSAESRKKTVGLLKRMANMARMFNTSTPSEEREWDEAPLSEDSSNEYAYAQEADEAEEESQSQMQDVPAFLRRKP